MLVHGLPSMPRYSSATVRAFSGFKWMKMKSEVRKERVNEKTGAPSVGFDVSSAMSNTNDTTKVELIVMMEEGET